MKNRWSGREARSFVRRYAKQGVNKDRALRVYTSRLLGGEPGKHGRNTLIRADGTRVELEGIARVSVQPGDILRIETPGGGGYGRLHVESPQDDAPNAG